VKITCIAAIIPHPLDVAERGGQRADRVDPRRAQSLSRRRALRQA
jgi:hypothetical protein